MCSCRYLAGLYNCSVPRHRFHSTPVSLPLRTPYPSRLVNMSSPWRGEAGKPGKASKASKTEKGAKLKSKTPRRADREPAAAAAGPSPRDAASLCATASRCQGCVVVLSKLAQCRTRLQTADCRTSRSTTRQHRPLGDSHGRGASVTLYSSRPRRFLFPDPKHVSITFSRAVHAFETHSSLRLITVP